MNKKRVLITGINGMDGSHLADFLLATGDYEIFGIERRKATYYSPNIEHLIGNINLIKGDLSDQNSLLRAIKECEPHEVYNLGAQSFVGESWAMPEQTSDITGLGALRILEAIREHGNQDIKFYQASSSEMFGKKGGIANEETTFYPCSPYGVSKLYAHWITKNYRESYGMFAVSGILFNHESERRGHEFVTRKISDGVAKIYLGLSDHISLGNLDAFRDWGYAPDYVEGMWMMMQQEKSDDYILATGKTHSIKDFLGEAFNCVGIQDWSKYIKTDSKLFRPVEVDYLLGDPSKAMNVLGWKPKTSFKDLVSIMVKNDIKLLNQK
jgi:GDPmannose 4,6-dehydratase